MSLYREPLGAQRVYERPDIGTVITCFNAAWKITAVEMLEMNDDDREQWLDRGMPDLETWRDRPYQLVLEYLGGELPDGADPAEHVFELPVRACDRVPTWYVYPSGRWPKCSCCDHPMPCQEELRDQHINATMDALERHTRKLPGCCWGCGEPITNRQKHIAYPGENLDLPGGIEVRFHRKYGEHGCSRSAENYERRWVAADPRLERVLTWPACNGILAVHADGSSECVSGPGPFGGWTGGEPDCNGHLTHDHQLIQNCHSAGEWWSGSQDEPECPRCPPSHLGTRTTPRPPRPEQPTITTKITNTPSRRATR